MSEPSDPRPLDEDVAAIGSLQDPLRRALYRYVASRGEEVSRDEAAHAVGVQRPLAAFHLDKLVDAGVLEVTYRRLTGRTGPGAGRPAKLYRRSPAEHSVTLPPRHYELAATLLVEAVEKAGNRPARQSLRAVARRFGRDLGEKIRAGLDRRAGRERRLSALAEALERYGYEPRQERRAVHLANCPFHALAENHRELVCGMNLSLLEGVIDGMDDKEIEARFDPRPGECCVTVAARQRRT